MSSHSQPRHIPGVCFLCGTQKTSAVGVTQRSQCPCLEFQSHSAQQGLGHLSFFEDKPLDT